MNFEQKQHFLFELQNQKEINPIQEHTILILSGDREILIRCDVAETLSFFINDFSKEILLRLAKDKNKLVRVEAVDALGCFLDNDVFEALLDCANDTDYLVRSYSINSLYYISTKLEFNKKDMILFFENKILNEKSSFVKLQCFLALYQMGSGIYLKNIFRMFKSKNYKLRCAIVKGLCDVISRENLCELKEFFETHYPDEESFAVTSTMDQLKKIMDDYIEN